MLLFDSIPFSGEIVTISPGSMSRTKVAPTVSSAQVSEAMIYALSLFPMQSGLNPKGSLAPISFLGDMTTRE